MKAGAARSCCWRRCYCRVDHGSADAGGSGADDHGNGAGDDGNGADDDGNGAADDANGTDDNSDADDHDFAADDGWDAGDDDDDHDVDELNPTTAAATIGSMPLPNVPRVHPGASKRTQRNHSVGWPWP